MLVTFIYNVCITCFMVTAVWTREAVASILALSRIKFNACDLNESSIWVKFLFKTEHEEVQFTVRSFRHEHKM